MMRLSALCILGFVLASLAVPAFAAPLCAGRADVAAGLKRDYGEVPQLQGVSQDGMLMEFWANPKTGTWTATVTSPDGQTCLVAAGDQAQIVKPGNPA